MLNHRISYFYSPNIGLYYFGQGHHMKPFRATLVNELVYAYDLDENMNIYRPCPASSSSMTDFHSQEYVNFLQIVRPETLFRFPGAGRDFGINPDCPIFPYLYEYAQLSAGGSIAAAVHLTSGYAETAINWMGGMHHAKKQEASGFCYINDIVLGILELLKMFPRVLYLDIDAHHGDGVEEAFYTCSRVMCVSFHKFGNNFFPCTGGLDDIGAGEGTGYSVNVPLEDGIRDVPFFSMFKGVVDECVKRFAPSAVVLQCGADSLAGDRIASLNLSILGHSECVRYVRDLGLPLMVVGGGGYTMKNVARCWTYETAVLCRQRISEEIPYNPFYNYYGPDYLIPIVTERMKDSNTEEKLHNILSVICENLRKYVRPVNPNKKYEVKKTIIVKNKEELLEIEDNEDILDRNPHIFLIDEDRADSK